MAEQQTEDRRPAIVAVADSDSYLKWSAATLRAMPPRWQTSQVVIDSPIRPSAAQIRSAAGEPVEVLRYAAVIDLLRIDRPDAVLLACTGPVVAAVAADRLFRGPARPVMITGLPGISIPASGRAVDARAGCDLFLLHSRREIAEFTRLGPQHGPDLVFGLASLPFLSRRQAADDQRRTVQLIFAAQAKVPSRRSDREQILLALADAGPAVIKLRAVDEEQQTHHEQWPYPVLLADLEAQGTVAPSAVGLLGGSMDEALRGARALVTVSSTAALESMAVGLPTLIISDFGISPDLINTVFVGSGCLGTLDDLREGRITPPDSDWLEANYFHPGADNDWLDHLEDLLTQRATGGLPVRGPSGYLPKRVHRRVRLLLPASSHPRLGALRASVRRAAARSTRIVHELRHGLRLGTTPAGRHSGRRAGHRPPPPARPPGTSGRGR
jgi:hypothetical protein